MAEQCFGNGVAQKELVGICLDLLPGFIHIQVQETWRNICKNQGTLRMSVTWSLPQNMDWYPSGILLRSFPADCWGSKDPTMQMYVK